MREIKFRAWVPSLNAFAYSDECVGYSFEMSKRGGLQFCHWEKPDLQSKEIETEDWQQYTGLKDKNDKPIFEGDIVKAEQEGNWVGAVEWADAGWCLIADGFSDMFDGLSYEILGNIHEDGHLLKEGE